MDDKVKKKKVQKNQRKGGEIGGKKTAETTERDDRGRVKGKGKKGNVQECTPKGAAETPQASDDKVKKKKVQKNQRKGGQKGGGDRKSKKYKESQEKIEGEACHASESGDGKPQERPENVGDPKNPSQEDDQKRKESQADQENPKGKKAVRKGGKQGLKLRQEANLDSSSQRVWRVTPQGLVMENPQNARKTWAITGLTENGNLAEFGKPVTNASLIYT